MPTPRTQSLPRPGRGDRCGGTRLRWNTAGLIRYVLGGQGGVPVGDTGGPGKINTRPTVDVDGDGRPDIEFISTRPDAPGVTFGARTASGAIITASMGLSASPFRRSVLFADVTEHGDVIALASDGRQVQLGR